MIGLIIITTGLAVSCGVYWHWLNKSLLEKSLWKANFGSDLNRSNCFMPKLERITMDPAVMGGKPCIRGLRVTVGTIVGLVAAGKSRDEVLRLYPYLEAADIDEALAYATWRVEEQEIAVSGA